MALATMVKELSGMFYPKPQNLSPKTMVFLLIQAATAPPGIL